MDAKQLETQPLSTNKIAGAESAAKSLPSFSNLESETKMSEVKKIRKTNVAKILSDMPGNPTFGEMKEALRAHYGHDSLTDGRATDLVGSYLYVSQFRIDRP